MEYLYSIPIVFLFVFDLVFYFSTPERFNHGWFRILPGSGYYLYWKYRK